MNTSNLKSILVAAAVSLSLLPVAQAHATEPSRDTGVGKVIAAQGNAALQLIRQEMNAAVRAARPVMPARPRMTVQVAEARPRQVGDRQTVTLLVKN
jgi:hypothetical protein